VDTETTNTATTNTATGGTGTGDTGDRNTARTLDGMLAQRAGRYWWVVLLSGIAWLLIAWVVLRMDVRSLTAVGLLIGVVFLIAGVNEAALARLVTGGWKLLHYGIAAAFVLAGLWAFVRPINTFFALASVLGLILFLEGAFEIVRAVGGRAENPFWLMGLAVGILLVLLGFWVSTSDRAFDLGARGVLILLWVGFMALFRGISQIGLAFGVRRLTAADPARPAPAGAGEAAEVIAQVIPTQESRSPASREAAEPSAPTAQP
jgi:uncharacterized membrane protein HdeD (DUF308 family)